VSRKDGYPDKIGQDPDARMGELAAAQHGNVTRRQLLKIGLTHHAICHRLAAARLYRVHRGVYAVGRRPVTWLERAAAAVLACGPTAVLSHRSALALWDLGRWETPFHVTVTAGHPRPRGLVVHRYQLAGPDLTTQLAIRATSPARTLLDCALELKPAALTRAVNDARHAHILTLDQLHATLARYPLHPGAGALRPHADTTEAPTRSGWEDAFPAFCARHGLPRPRMNTTVCGFEVDAFFEAEKVIVELDSWEFHSSRAAFERDRARDAITTAAGHVTMRLTTGRMRESPDAEAQQLLALLHARRGPSG
jgi:hypothetical protein